MKDAAVILVDLDLVEAGHPDGGLQTEPDLAFVVPFHVIYPREDAVAQVDLAFKGSGHRGL